MNGWTLLTTLGDANITLPVALMLAVWLLMSGEKRLALWWSVLFGALLILVAASKLVFLGWGIGIASLDFTGISGHASRAAAVVPAALYLFFGDTRPAWRRQSTALSYLLAAVIAASRVMVEAHSVAEAVVGYALGALVSALFIRQMAGHVRRPPRRPVIWAGVSIVGAALLLGPAPTKAWMREAAVYLSGKDAPFQRGDL